MIKCNYQRWLNLTTWVEVEVDNTRCWFPRSNNDAVWNRMILVIIVFYNKTLPSTPHIQHKLCTIPRCIILTRIFLLFFSHNTWDYGTQCLTSCHSTLFIIDTNNSRSDTLAAAKRRRERDGSDSPQAMSICSASSSNTCPRPCPCCFRFVSSNSPPRPRLLILLETVTKQITADTMIVNTVITVLHLPFQSRRRLCVSLRFFSSLYIRPPPLFSAISCICCSLQSTTLVTISQA